VNPVRVFFRSVIHQKEREMFKSFIYGGLPTMGLFVLVAFVQFLAIRAFI